MGRPAQLQPEIQCPQECHLVFLRTKRLEIHGSRQIFNLPYTGVCAFFFFWCHVSSCEKGRFMMTASVQDCIAFLNFFFMFETISEASCCSCKIQQPSHNSLVKMEWQSTAGEWILVHMTHYPWAAPHAQFSHGQNGDHLVNIKTRWRQMASQRIGTRLSLCLCRRIP